MEVNQHLIYQVHNLDMLGSTMSTRNYAKHDKNNYLLSKYNMIDNFKLDGHHKINI